MAKYRQRLQEADAIRYDGSARSLQEIFDWSGGALDVSTDERGRITIETLEGEHKVSPGNYIVKDVAGAFYPMSADLFELKFEAITEGQRK